MKFLEVREFVREVTKDLVNPSKKRRLRLATERRMSYKYHKLHPPGILVANVFPSGVERDQSKKFPMSGLKWWPKPGTVQKCCKNPKLEPTPFYPFNLLNHCKTIKHLAEEFQVPYYELREWVREAELEIKFRKADWFEKQVIYAKWTRDESKKRLVKKFKDVMRKGNGESVRSVEES